MSITNKVVVTCALTGVLTDPVKFNVPVTPEEMANAALQAYNAGASIVHCHFRHQKEGLRHLPTWEIETVSQIITAIKSKVPDIIINMSTGVMGDDINGPLGCLEALKPCMAACNAGSLNYLKIRKDGTWAWPPILFDNPVQKIQKFLDVMGKNNIIPEFECFDLGIVRSVSLFKSNGMFKGDPHVSFVMGVESGMPARVDILPILKDELPENSHWQTIVTGSAWKNHWEVHKGSLELGGDVRTGLEDTFYLPNGDKATNNGQLIEALVTIVHEVGKEVATPQEARQILNLDN